MKMETYDWYLFGYVTGRGIRFDTETHPPTGTEDYVAFALGVADGQNGLSAQTIGLDSKVDLLREVNSRV